MKCNCVFDDIFSGIVIYLQLLQKTNIKFQCGRLSGDELIYIQLTDLDSLIALSYW